MYKKKGGVVRLLLKTLAILIVLALVASQLQLYYNTVIAGTYIQTATIFRLITGVVLWPLLSVLIGGVIIWKIGTYNGSPFN